MIRASHPCTARRSASSISSADSTRTVSALAGGSTVADPSTSRVVAPRSIAARASSTPCRPLAGLPMKRTGSMYSRVPPADTTNTRPLSGPFRPSVSRMTSSSTGVSGRRPLPCAPDASRPLSGSIRPTPRRRSVARLSCVAGLAYMPGSIAGATTMGAWVASAMAEPRSSAWPVRQPSDGIGRRRGNNQHVGVPGQPHVCDFMLGGHPVIRPGTPPAA